MNRIPMLIATDGDLTQLVEGNIPDGLAGKIECIDKALKRNGHRLVLLPPIQERLITDNYPLADCGFLLKEVEKDALANRPTLNLPF